jgi:lipoprotein-releasing system permease protein
MSFEFFLAKRFLAGQRFGVFRLVTTVIAIGGTALGVGALLVTLAVMDGFRSDIQEKILGTQPHLVVVNPIGALQPEDPETLARISAQPHVKAAAPYIYGQALIQSGSSVTGILLRGVNPSAEVSVTNLVKAAPLEQWLLLDDHSVALGAELARAVGVGPGDFVTLVAPQERIITQNQMPRMRRYRVQLLFHSGMYEYDANLAIMTIPAAQDLLGFDHHITGYGVRLDELEAAQKAAPFIQQAAGPAFWVRSWQDLNRNLFSAMKLERTTMFLILMLIILVSSFTIISNLLLLTIEKAREIGILQALGATPAQIGRIFLLNGLILGGSGVSLGLILGIGISAFLKRYPIIKLPADVYYIDKLPIQLSSGAVGSVAGCAFLLVLVSILYPAWKAGRMDPVQAIRFG